MNDEVAQDSEYSSEEVEVALSPEEKLYQELLEKLYAERLITSLEAIRKVFDITIGWAADPLLMDKVRWEKSRSKNRIGEWSQEADNFRRIFAFPFRARRVIMTSKMFRQLPMLTALYPVQESSPDFTAPNKSYRPPLITRRPEYQKDLEVDFDQESIRAMTNGELVQTTVQVGREQRELANRIDASVTQVVRGILRDPELKILLESAVESIAENIEITINQNKEEDESGPLDGAELKGELLQYIRKQPKLLLKILNMIGQYQFPLSNENKLFLSDIFGYQDLVDFTRWLERKSTQAVPRDRKNESNQEDEGFESFPKQKMTAQFKNAQAPTVQLEMNLKGIKMAHFNEGKSEVTVHNFPRRGHFSDTLTLFPKIAEPAFWAIHWSGLADDYRAIGHRLEFMSSDQALSVLSLEVGVETGTTLQRLLVEYVQELQMLYQSLNTIHHHLRSKGLLIGETYLTFNQWSLNLKYGTKNFGDEIRKLLLKPPQLSYQKQIQELSEEIKKNIGERVQTIQKLLRALTELPSIPPDSEPESRQRSYPVYPTIPAEQLRIEIEKCQEALQKELNRIDTIDQTVSTFEQELFTHMRPASSGSTDFTTPTVPPVLSEEAERFEEVNVPIDDRKGTFIADRANIIIGGQAPVSIEDLLAQFDLEEKNDNKSDRSVSS